MAEISSGGDDAFALDAGWLCLDFTNTVLGRPISEKVDLIHDYSGLLSWARQATILTPGEAAALTETAHRQPRAAAAALRQTLSLREALYGLFSARAAGLPPEDSDLHTINKAIGRAMSRAGLNPAVGGGFAWGWPDAALGMDRVAWWVARSAAELLTSEDLTHVRECAGFDCGRLFMDGTKNRSRRWCDMARCGNRAKGRRHYERHRSTPAEPG
jgi:predicted RNA-binding Zn ribbon-like protein